MEKNQNDKARITAVHAVATGEAVPLSRVPDAVFAEKVLGDGIAILPKEGKIVSPVAGRVTSIAPTKHAIGICSEDGLQILVHVGLDTVSLRGEGFILHVAVGDTVKIGTPLVDFDIDLMKQKGISPLTPVLVTGEDQNIELIEPITGGVRAGDHIVYRARVANAPQAAEVPWMQRNPWEKRLEQ